MKTFDQLVLDRSAKRSLQAQLAGELKILIQSGKLRRHQRLPSTRALADHLQVSRNTVVAAYDLLSSEGYVKASERSAFVVSLATESFGSSPLRPYQRPHQSKAVQPPSDPVPFRPTQPDVNLFSLKEWNRHRTQVLKRGSSLLHYQSRFSMGLDELRRALADYLRDSRGVRCDWQEIAVTGGSQQALFMLGHMLLDETRTAYMEDPGYPGARRSWEQARANVVPVPVDEAGIRLPLPDAPLPTLVYVTPSHQFPLGVCMSLERRLKLLRLAQERGLWIVEDDYDAEFRYTSAPQPSLQSLDDHGRVIYVGSFSKTLFPGVRLGYVVLPPPLVEPFTRLKLALDDHGPLLDQATLASFLESGAFYSHLRHCRRVYRRRQEFFLDLVRQKGLPFTFPITGRGMNLAGRVAPGVNDRQYSHTLTLRGLDTPALSSYSTLPDAPAGLLFGLTAFDEQKIREGVERLASVFTDAATGRRTTAEDHSHLQ